MKSIQTDMFRPKVEEIEESFCKYIMEKYSPNEETGTIFAKCGASIHTTEKGIVKSKYPDLVVGVVKLRRDGLKVYTHDEIKIDVEIDGKDYHTGLTNISRDFYRDIELQDIGWSVVRLTATDIVNRTDACYQHILYLALMKAWAIDVLERRSGKPKLRHVVGSINNLLFSLKD